MTYEIWDTGFIHTWLVLEIHAMPVTVCNMEMERDKDMRRNAKVDDNQTSIVSALRKAGCSVLSLAAIGGGCPDLLVYRRSTGLLYMLEVKDGDKYPSQRKLTPHQVKFHKDWPVHVVNNLDEALEACGI
jgi:hypothetical protein